MKQRTIDVKGLTIEDIISMDVNKLGLKDLRAVSARLVSASNKRIKYLKKSPIAQNTKALLKVEKMGRKFSIKNKGLDQIREEFANMRNFLKLKTSTVKGVRQLYKETKQKLETRLGKKISNDKYSLFWQVYTRLENYYGEFSKASYPPSEEVQAMIYDTLKNNNDLDIDDIIERMMNIIDGKITTEDLEDEFDEDFELPY